MRQGYLQPKIKFQLLKKRACPAPDAGRAKKDRKIFNKNT